MKLDEGNVAWPVEDEDEDEAAEAVAAMVLAALGLEEALRGDVVVVIVEERERKSFVF